jgi:hypothetical protein
MAASVSAMSKKAGLKATESVLRSLMPELDAKVNALQTRIDELESSLAKKIEVMFDRQERRLEAIANQLIERLESKADRTEEKLQALLRLSDEKAEARFVHVEKVVNDVGSRVTRLEGMLQAYTEQSTRAAASYGELLERIVRVEVAQEPGALARLERKLDSALRVHRDDEPQK